MWRDRSGGFAPRRWRFVVVITLVVALGASLVVVEGANAQEASPGLGGAAPVGGLGPSEMFGLGAGDALGMITPEGAWGIVGSGSNLDQFDPLTGTQLGDYAGDVLSLDQSIAQDMLAADQLAFDARALAERSRAQAEAKRRAAEADAKRRGIAFDPRPSKGVAADWELKNFSTCGSSANSSRRARIEMVEVWEEMCQAASGAGIRLVVTSAYRDNADQQRLWADGVRKYGSEASKWVARPRADGSCSSRHCTGEAIDVSQQNGAGGWLHATAGCYANGAFSPATTCGTGQRKVKRAQLYGFVFPMDHEPWHIELGIPVAGVGGGSGMGDCNPPGSYSIPQMVASIFRCRLSEAGITGSAQDTVVAEALVVSKCESAWNPSAVVFGGRYTTSPHPSTGLRYTAAGVFQFIRSTANAYVDGGYDNVKDPVKNIDAGARLYLANRSWSPWECAVGGRFHGAKGALPQHGGPSLPQWAFDY